MATDLVRWGVWDEGHPKDGGEGDEWDRPPQPEPDQMRPPPKRHTGAALKADRDAASARGRGDGTFAVERETDAAEHRQNAWDWGNARTWLIIGAMCLGFVLLSLWVYFMPHGRHNQNDGPNPTPTIRVY